MTKKNLIVLGIAVLFVAGSSVGAWAEKQPHMKGALENLRQAKAQLEKADPDKGGHRAEAIKLIDQAIQEVKAGVEYDNEHKDKK